MSIKQQPAYISHEEYLEGELTSPSKHEYIQGQVYAMSGVRDAHNLISLNIASLLRSLLRGARCRVFMADVKVRVEAADTFYYPDVFVTCDEGDRTDRYVKRRPSLIVEVLSPRTETFDRELKRQHYQTVESLEDYILIRQDQVAVEHYSRERSGEWSLASYAAGQEVPIGGLSISLPVDGVYEDVEF